MNVLDENIPDSQRQLLRSWGIPIKQIGHDLSLKGVTDENIIALLCQLHHPVFFTRDQRLYKFRLCHPRYALVVLDVGPYDVATFVRRLLRHPKFDTHAKRVGAVIRVTRSAISVRRFPQQREVQVPWID